MSRTRNANKTWITMPQTIVRQLTARKIRRKRRDDAEEKEDARADACPRTPIVSWSKYVSNIRAAKIAQRCPAAS